MRAWMDGYGYGYGYGYGCVCVCIYACMCVYIHTYIKVSAFTRSGDCATALLWLRTFEQCPGHLSAREAEAPVSPHYCEKKRETAVLFGLQFPLMIPQELGMQS